MGILNGNFEGIHIGDLNWDFVLGILKRIL